jgi:AmmeMemoRadiSam system protein A
MLTEQQRSTLMAVARRAVADQVLLGTVDPVALDVDFPEASGVFVTIKKRGQLRGCLGTLQCRAGLAEEVARCAAESASDDPRFPPVTQDELPELSLEISVLGPSEAIDPRDERAVTIGRHGLIAERGLRRGLLLPQVATEWGWTVDQFLRQTCLKAGLPADAWEHGATIHRFEAEVFGE